MKTCLTTKSNKAPYWVTVVLVGMSASAASAQLLETRSNYMGIDWSSSWASVGNWGTVTPYTAEPGDGGGDIDQISMAHDDTYLYIYFNQASGFAYGNDTQYIFFDTDLNSSTGTLTDYWWWGSSTGGVGAEHSMYGAALRHEATQDFTWVDNWLYVDPCHADGQYDILIRINRSQLGNPASFNWTARMFGVDDYYPNSGNYHRYEFVGTTPPACGPIRFDADGDGDVDMDDFAAFQRCASGPGLPADPACDD